MKTILIETQFLPPVEFFCALTGGDFLWLEAHENYVKQTYRNRCHVLGANGTQRLVVPVLHGKGTKILTKNAEIDYSTRWVNDHLRTIESSYGKSPFFEHYYENFRTVYLKKHKYLWALNLEMLTICLTSLGLSIEVSETKSFSQEHDKVKINDLRGMILPKKMFNCRKIITPVPYIQMFGRGFAGNLSIIDLIFCCGPESLKVVTDSVRKV